MGGSPVDEDDFEVHGPTHMRSTAAADSRIVVDWNNEEHCRCVTACLVKGTCVMENDRIKCRMYKNALAPAWWDNFGFVMMKMFINDSDKHDQFTYGAIFQLMEPAPSAPQYVVAFRGTMLFHPKVMEELLQDFWVVFNAVADYARFKRTHPDVGALISDNGSVWLAGHSLGASMALEIGRNLMLENGHNVPTFLFNPPHVSPAKVIHDVLTEEHKTRLYTVSFMVKFGLVNLLPGYHKRTKLLFEKLAPWVPELYVNPNDFISRGYIDYFVQRQLVSKNQPRYAKTAARASYRDMFFSMFHKVQPHLLPSARLWTSSMQKNPHGLRQWWKPDCDLELSNTRYSYPLDTPL